MDLTVVPDLPVNCAFVIFLLISIMFGTEKKLLQSKLRKASAGRVSGDLSKSVASSRKDISTSTDDLGKGGPLIFLCYY